MTAEQQRTRETIATAIVSAAAANYLRDLYGPGRAGPG